MNTFIIKFRNKIDLWEVPLFRGAVINATEGKDILFHNHLQDTFRYKYPLIQYKRIGGKASIVCLGDGAEAIGDFLSKIHIPITVGERKVLLEVESVKGESTLVRQWNDTFYYSLRKYLPLNQENYKTYAETESVIEKYKIIERCLVGNILSFAKSMGVFFDGEVVAKITQMEPSRIYTYKNVKMTGFDLQFQSNVSLPDFIGLGKNVSVGFGMVTKIRNNK